MKVTLDMFNQAVKNGMKVLHLDIETSPMLVYTHYIGSKVSLSHGQIKQGAESKVICTQYMWETDKEAKYIPWKGKAGNWDDTLVLQKTAELIKQSDLIIGQNLDSFDMKVLQGRMVTLGLEPFDYDLTLDVLKMSRKSFRFASQKLDHRAKQYGNRGKDRMYFDDWIDVVEGTVPVSAKMGPYGCQDVTETRFVLHKEFDGYRNLPLKVQKLILSFLTPDKKLYCDRCAKRRQRRYDIKVKQRKDFKEVSCNRCGDEWTLHGPKGQRK